MLDYILIVVMENFGCVREQRVLGRMCALGLFLKKSLSHLESGRNLVCVAQGNDLEHNER